MSVRYNNEIHGASVAQTGCAMMTEYPKGKKPWRIERAKALSLMAHGAIRTGKREIRAERVRIN